MYRKCSQFLGEELTVRIVLKGAAPFSVLWSLSGYLYLLALCRISKVDVSAVVCCSQAFTFLLSWIGLKDRFMGVRVSKQTGQRVCERFGCFIIAVFFNQLTYFSPTISTEEITNIYLFIYSNFYLGSSCHPVHHWHCYVGLWGWFSQRLNHRSGTGSWLSFNFCFIQGRHFLFIPVTLSNSKKKMSSKLFFQKRSLSFSDRLSCISRWRQILCYEFVIESLIQPIR